MSEAQARAGWPSGFFGGGGASGLGRWLGGWRPLAMKRTVPRRTLRGLVKKYKPGLRLSANTDLLVYLNFLLFLHRLAEESRTKAVEEKSKRIKYEHVVSSAKIILKKSRG